MSNLTSKTNSKTLFLKACQGQSNLPRPPVWFMRQAGRYLPEYQAIRKNLKFLELCRNPELAAEVSVQPVEIIDVDAAIIFSDILLPLADFGIDVDFPETGGIRIVPPPDLLLPDFKIGDNVKATTSAIKVLKQKLTDKNFDVPTLGFAGAPWTLANYIIQGGTAKGGEFSKAKQLAWTNPELTIKLLEKLTDMTIKYLKAQIEAGVDAVQLFDTWAGELSEEDFKKFALPFCKEVFAGLPTNIPKIIYVKGSSPFVEDLSEIGADILSLDWRISLTEAWKKISKKKKNTIKCLQGNLDPLKLTIDAESAYKETLKIIKEGQKLPCGHILNLGHGVTPEAKVESAKAFVRASKDLE